MDILNVFGLHPDSDTSFIQVKEPDEDVGANVILSTSLTPPEPMPMPKNLIKVMSSHNQLQKILKIYQKKTTKVSKPFKPSLKQHEREDYALQIDKEEIAPEHTNTLNKLNEEVLELTQNADSNKVEDEISKFTQNGVTNKVKDEISEFTQNGVTIKVKDEISEFTQNGDNKRLNNESELIQNGVNQRPEFAIEKREPTMKQYELLYPGGPLVLINVEQVPEEHDCVPGPDLVEYFCGVCGKSYSTEVSVRKHMTRTHSGPAQLETQTGQMHSGPALGTKNGTKKLRNRAVRIFTCDICGCTRNSAAAVRYHRRVHTGEKPYNCPLCPKSFAMPLLLKVHIRTHTGERPYKCENCPKAFISQASMQRHERVHTGIKPYRCEECGKCFSQSNTKKLHYLTVHLKQPWPYGSKERRHQKLKKNDALPQMETAARTDSPSEPSRGFSLVLRNGRLKDSFLVYNDIDDYSQ